MSYWYVHWREDDRGAVAFLRTDEPLFVVHGHALTDYLANDQGINLCSERMKDVIESAAPGACAWVPADVVVGQHSERYFILRSNENMVLSPHTVRTKLCVVKAVLDKAAVPTSPILQVEEGSFRWAVSENVKELMRRQKLSGVEFSKVAER